MAKKKGKSKMHVLGAQIATPAINSRWFHDRLADKQLSLRGYSKLVQMDPSATSRMFAGEREIKMDEAIAFATIVGVPLDDVMVNAGLRPPMMNARGMLPIIGYVDAAGEVHRGQVEAPRRTAMPPEVSEACCAVLRFRTGMSSAEALDGWLVYFDQTVKRVPPEAVGRLCIVSIVQSGSKIGFVRRGYERGTFTVTPWTPGAVAIENVMLDWASPVLWIKTGA